VKGKEKLVAVVVADEAVDELASARSAAAQADSEEERRALAARVFTQFRRYSAGGLQMFDEEELKRQRGVVWELVKMVGNRIAEGMELRDIGVPIQLLQPSSMLECMTRAWAFAPVYLAAAARTTDPVERFKLAITFAISGMHLSAQCKKPFNPILGETFQAAFCDGTDVYMEQTTHHPPASNWQMVGAGNTFQYWGRGVGSASARGNVIRGYQHGPNVLDFPNGQRITWNLPVLTVQGIAWGDRVQHFDGMLQFRDDTNHLSCDLHMNAEALGFVKSLFSKPKQPTDYLRGDIMVGPPTKQTKVATVEGSWLTHLEIGGTRYWAADANLPFVLRPKASKETLESDSFKREDLLAFAEGDMERCAECKLMLEERQRYDRRLREKARSARK
jgi:hypothetical protein